MVFKNPMHIFKDIVSQVHFLLCQIFIVMGTPIAAACYNKTFGKKSQEIQRKLEVMLQCGSKKFLKICILIITFDICYSSTQFYLTNLLIKIAETQLFCIFSTFLQIILYIVIQFVFNIALLLYDCTQFFCCCNI